jgi:Asp/Glu/hydantoin racemase
MCSSAGEVVDLGRLTIDTVPLLRIDEPMAAEAVRSARRVGVLATLPTTLDPTVRLIRQQAARIGKEVEVVDGLAEGAYQILRQGQPERHDEMIIETAVKIADRSDVFVLAQASMARVEAKIRERTGKPVLSSPEPCLLHIKSLFEK